MGQQAFARSSFPGAMRRKYARSLLSGTHESWQAATPTRHMNYQLEARAVRSPEPHALYEFGFAAASA